MRGNTLPSGLARCDLETLWSLVYLPFKRSVEKLNYPKNALGLPFLQIGQSGRHPQRVNPDLPAR